MVATSRFRAATAAAAVGVLFALVAAGCGGGGSDDDAATTTTTGSTVPAGATTAPAVTSAAPTVAPTVAPGAGFVQESETGALRIGQKGPRVLALQAKLKALGFDPGAIDGLFGSNTQNTVKGFQTAKALEVDGVAGPLTLAAVDAACQAASCPAG